MKDQKKLFSVNDAVSDADGECSGTGSGNTKKFLYRGKGSEHSTNDKQFGSMASKNSAQTLDLDNVWSIRKNVGIGKQRADGLSYNANKNFYSRHGGIKERDTGSSKLNEEGGKSWSQGKRTFSYTNSSQSTPPGSGGTRQSNSTNSGRHSGSYWSNSQHNF